MSKEALAKQEQSEPVAEVKRNSSGQIYIDWRDGEFAIANLVEAKLYTTPQQRTWVGLTDAERYEIHGTTKSPYDDLLVVEAVLKQKNKG